MTNQRYTPEFKKQSDDVLELTRVHCQFRHVRTPTHILCRIAAISVFVDFH